MNITEKNYVDITGDLIAGLLLYAIQNEKKNIVQKNGHHWVVLQRSGWWDRARISPYQYDRALKILKNKGLVTTKIFKSPWDPPLDGIGRSLPVTHIRINEEILDQY